MLTLVTSFFLVDGAEKRMKSNESAGHKLEMHMFLAIGKKHAKLYSDLVRPESEKL